MKIQFVIISLFQCVFAKISDPYATLHISRDANSQQIKKAFKTLAREWHPDKNNHPDAQNKFVEISEAYKLLSDSNRRKLYDLHEQTEESLHQRPHTRHFDMFEEMFSAFHNGGSFRFHSNEDAIKFYAEKSISKSFYEKILLPSSKQQPYILMFYSNWCIACAQVEPIWRRLIEELEPINFAMNTVHAGHENDLCKKLGVKTVPYVVLVLDGHAYHYTQPSLSISSCLEFIKSKFPSSLVTKIDEDNVDPFLSGWKDNKARLLIFGRLDVFRMRYLTLAWEFKDRVTVGYVQLDTPNTENIQSRYGVSNKVDTLLVFHEDWNNPVASVAMSNPPYPTIRDVVNANKFLTLPRLSSQIVFDSLCPVEALHSRRRLCVVLVTRDIPEHDPARASLRAHAAYSRPHDFEKLRYLYIFKEKQHHFVTALTSGSSQEENPDLHIVIIWRKDRTKLSFEWVPERWALKQENKSKEALKNTLRKLLYTSQPMAFEVEIKDLFDEHAAGLIWRILNRLASYYNILSEKLTYDDTLPALSLLATFLFIVAAGYVMQYLTKLEEERLEKGNQSKNGKETSQVRQLKMHELRGETYNGLIRLLKPGCRTIVMICDTQTVDKLMPKFHRSAWPYRKNKTLMFGFLNVDRNSAMNWYKKILMLGLLEPRELRINPKNIIGTVLALNGHRKYYCIYHAKHPEHLRKANSGEFLGFSESDTDSNEDVEIGDRKKDSLLSTKAAAYGDVLFQDQLLEGLPNWLDRLFEGSTQRYYINYWPDWPGK